MSFCVPAWLPMGSLVLNYFLLILNGRTAHLLALDQWLQLPGLQLQRQIALRLQFLAKKGWSVEVADILYPLQLFFHFLKIFGLLGAANEAAVRGRAAVSMDLELRNAGLRRLNQALLLAAAILRGELLVAIFVWGCGWSALNKISIVDFIVLITATFFGVLHEIDDNLLTVEIDTGALLLLMIGLVCTGEAIFGEFIELDLG